MTGKDYVTFSDRESRILELDFEFGLELDFEFGLELDFELEFELDFELIFFWIFF